MLAVKPLRKKISASAPGTFKVDFRKWPQKFKAMATLWTELSILIGSTGPIRSKRRIARGRNFITILATDSHSQIRQRTRK